MNVYKLSSSSICCIESNIVFICNHLLGTNNSFWQFYQIMFHCIQGFLCKIILYLLYLCPSQVLVYLGFGGFMSKTPFINFLICVCSDISSNPGSYCIQCSSLHVNWCIINTWIVCEEFYNVIYMWLKRINLPSTTKVSPSLENCS